MKYAITALVVALVCTSAMGYSYLWSGPAGGQWIVAGNWTPLDGGTTFPQGGADTGVFLSSASVTTTGLVNLPSLNLTGTLDMTIPSGTLNSPNGTTITGSGSIIERGAIKFNQGASPNDWSGGLTIASGKAYVSGGDICIPGPITLSGGSLQLLESDHIGATANIIFNSTGTAMGGVSGQINWSDLSQSLGTLSLQGAGDMNDLNFGGGDECNIYFADSHLADWSTGTALRIEFVPLAGASLAQQVGNIYVGIHQSGLQASQLAKITFVELDGTSWSDDGNYYSAAIDSTGRLYPVIAPEPMTLSLLLVGGIAGLIRRR